MFIDRVRIRTTGGDGGRGCVSFRREKYVPRGGPNGGDGGNGGSIVFEATSKFSTLLDLRYHGHWKGKRGAHGRGSDCRGKDGNDTIIPVPLGTLVKDFASGDLLADLTAEGECFCASKGGRGGKGNARFVTSTSRAPRFAELGEPGQEAEYALELKLIADVGIVGLPNAGKSTFLSVVSAAEPKIADYPFTTLSPNLGIAKLSDYRTLTIADIPGIIEGAAKGKGLGHDFLRHIERTQVLLFLIDLGDEDPVATRDVLEKELEGHSDVFAQRPRIYALNKSDITENRDRVDELVGLFDDASVISAATGDGVEAILERLWDMVDRVKREELEDDSFGPAKEYVYEPPYRVESMPGGFRLNGEAVRRAVLMTDFENEEAVRHLQKKLQRMGVFKTLQRMGAKDGQMIAIADVELVYQGD